METYFEDHAFGSSEAELDRGKLIAKFTPGTTYTIDTNPEIVGGAAIYQKSGSSEKNMISVACDRDNFSKMLSDIFAGIETIKSLKQKAYAQSLLDSLKDFEAPKFDQFDKTKN